ncbi:MAG: cell wall metabolism sensor histidine kinase WalK [Gemmatimonadetes bacterium]|nr:cell wall metabolism sensor histidine kinase WalK [Gemmatimonadota bacterium]
MVDRARSRALGGTGLGLAIVRHTMELLNGRAWVESRLGEGATFYLSLPAWIEDEPSETAGRSARATEESVNETSTGRTT